jgi:glucose/mannose transport system permease protein
MMRARNIAAHCTLALIALTFALPLIFMFITSLKPLAEINTGTLFDLPQAPTLAAWSKAWGAACIGARCAGISAGIWNSVLIVLPALVTSITLGALTGYALSLCTSRHANVLFVILLASLFIPGQVTLFPMIVWLRELGLFGTRAGVILVHTVWGLPFVSLLFRSFFLSVPRQILSAARIDGIGFFRILWHVLLPMSLPVCGVVLVLQFTYLWNDFLYGLTFSGNGSEPVTVILRTLTDAQYGVAEYNVHIAAALIVAAPTMLVYLFSSRLLIRTTATPETRRT